MLDVDVGNHQIFFKRAAARDDAAVFAYDHAVAVEDQLVLAADQIAIRQRNCVIFGAGAQHTFTVSDLAGVVGRGRYVDDEVGIAR